MRRDFSAFILSLSLYSHSILAGSPPGPPGPPPPVVSHEEATRGIIQASGQIRDAGFEQRGGWPTSAIGVAASVDLSAAGYGFVGAIEFMYFPGPPEKIQPFVACGAKFGDVMAANAGVGAIDTRGCVQPDDYTGYFVTVGAGDYSVSYGTSDNFISRLKKAFVVVGAGRTHLDETDPNIPDLNFVTLVNQIASLVSCFKFGLTEAALPPGGSELLEAFYGLSSSLENVAGPATEASNLLNSIMTGASLNPPREDPCQGVNKEVLVQTVGERMALRGQQTLVDQNPAEILPKKDDLMALLAALDPNNSNTNQVFKFMEFLGRELSGCDAIAYGKSVGVAEASSPVSSSITHYSKLGDGMTRAELGEFLSYLGNQSTNELATNAAASGLLLGEATANTAIRLAVGTMGGDLGLEIQGNKIYQGDEVIACYDLSDEVQQRMNQLREIFDPARIRDQCANSTATVVGDMIATKDEAVAVLTDVENLRTAANFWSGVFSPYTQVDEDQTLGPTRRDLEEGVEGANRGIDRANRETEQSLQDGRRAAIMARYAQDMTEYSIALQRWETARMATENSMKTAQSHWQSQRNLLNAIGEEYGEVAIRYMNYKDKLDQAWVVWDSEWARLAEMREEVATLNSSWEEANEQVLAADREYQRLQRLVNESFSEENRPQPPTAPELPRETIRRN